MSISNEALQNFINGIEDITDVEESFAVAIYGQNGTGKTRTASTFPKPLIIADVREKGTKSIKGIEGIKRRKISRWEDVELLYWFLKTQNHKLKEPFKTVVIDTFTQLEQLAIAYVMNKEAKEFGFEIDSQADMNMPKINDYGNAASLLKAWTMRFRDLVEDDIYVVFNLQERRSGNDDVDEDVHEVKPQLMKSILGILGGAVDYIVHTEIKEITRTVGGEIRSIPVYIGRIGPSSKYLTKFRVTPGVKLPPYMVNPSFEQMEQITNGEHKLQQKKKKNKNEEEQE